MCTRMCVGHVCVAYVQRGEERTECDGRSCGQRAEARAHGGVEPPPSSPARTATVRAVHWMEPCMPCDVRPLPQMGIQTCDKQTRTHECVRSANRSGRRRKLWALPAVREAACDWHTQAVLQVQAECRARPPGALVCLSPVCRCGLSGVTNPVSYLLKHCARPLK